MLYIGTSGFYYNHWMGKFYPEGIKKSDFFKFYMEKFNTVEINSTFYRLPSEKTMLSWSEKTPEDFKFSIKMWRRITHYKKLKDVEEDIELFLSRVSLLGKKLGIILIQLPPSIHFSPELLEDFLKILPPDFSYTIEFRHKSWFCEETISLLKRYGVTFCSLSIPKDFPDDIFITSDKIYYRFHGKKSLYNYCYTEDELNEFALRLREKMDVAGDIYIFFNNDFNGYAPRNAMYLKKILPE